jgi:hypothetical protein
MSDENDVIFARDRISDHRCGNYRLAPTSRRNHANAPAAGLNLVFDAR